MSSFNYEWWTVRATLATGPITLEFKAKNKDHAVKQILKEYRDSNSAKNLEADFWHRKDRIVDIHWDTLTLDRVGYQRMS